MYETFAHTADLGLRVRAADLNELFAEAASGLFSIVVSDVPPHPGASERSFEIDGGRLDLLLLDWLDELLYVFDTEQMLLRDFDVEVGGADLRASAWSQPLDADQHQLLREVKAITYHGLKVEKDSNGWLAEVIVDI